MAEVKDKRAPHIFKSQHHKQGKVPAQSHAADMVNAGGATDKLAFVKSDEEYFNNATGAIPTASEIAAMDCATAQSTYNSLAANASQYNTPVSLYIQYQQAQASLHAKITSAACTAPATPPSGTGGRPVVTPPTNPIVTPPAAPAAPSDTAPSVGTASINAGGVVITTTAPVQALGLSPYGGTSVGSGGGGGFGGGGGGSADQAATDVPLTWWQVALGWSKTNWWILLLAGAGVVYVFSGKGDGEA